jgi:XTP/dITP diphosphohydrolase
MTIYLASGNLHKKAELAAVLSGHTVRVPSDDGIVFDPDETGSSFLENALIKARVLYRLLLNGRTGAPYPVLADDSGLCVDALGGRPGIYSARYSGPAGLAGGKELSSPKRNALLLAELGPAENRGARFVCAMALVFSEERFYAVQETLEGVIVPAIGEARGGNGFGYDPILFIPELGKTVAELSEDEKNRVSHRGKAARALARFLAEPDP